MKSSLKDWILIILSSQLAHFLSLGMATSFGILYSSLAETFEVSNFDAAWVPSLFTGLIGLTGIPVGVAVTRFGERYVAVVGALLLSVGMATSMFTTKYSSLYISYGLVGGVGAGMLHFAGNTIVVKHFDKRRPLALSLASCGAAVSNLVLPPLISHCLDTYGWRGTFLILGGVSLNGVAAGLTFVQAPTEVHHMLKEDTINEDEVSCKKEIIGIIKDVKFMLFLTSSALCFLVVFVPLTFLPDLMKEAEFGKQQIYVALMVVGGSNLVGRLVVGFVANRCRSSVFTIETALVTSYAVVTMVTTVAESVVAIMVSSAVIGLIAGGYFGLHMSVVADLLTPRQLPVGYGIIMTVNGIMITAGMPLAGFIADTQGSQKSSFMFAGCVMFVSASVLGILMLVHYRTVNIDTIIDRTVNIDPIIDTKHQAYLSRQKIVLKR